MPPLSSKQSNMSKLKRNTRIDSTSRLIIKCINDRFDANLMDPVNLKTRKREFVEMRCIAFNLIFLNTNISLAKIGSYFGKDHATVLHGFKLCNNLLDVQKDFIENYEAIRDNVDNHLKIVNKIKDELEDVIYVDIKRSIIRDKIKELKKELLLLS